MSQTNVTIRMDEDIKRRFDIFCNELGMNMSTAMNMFAKAALRQNRIPFELSLDNDDPFYRESNHERILRSIKQLEEGRGHYDDT